MKFIDDFESHYNYDCTYMRKMAKSSPQGFETFVNFLPMGQYKKSLENEDIWIARLSSILCEDCGACAQLNINMAIEAGVKSELVRKVVKSPAELSPKHRLIFEFANAVAKNKDNHSQLQQKISELFNEEQLTELALAIASAKVYPAIKRSLGEFKSCSLYNFNF